MSYPLISIIIPVYNVTDFLEAAVHSAANQSYPAKEIILVNDGSDATATAEIERIAVQYDDVLLLHQQNKGAAAARDFGLEHANADYIVFLDADDLLLQSTLHAFSSAFAASPDAIAVYGKHQRINQKGHIIGAPLPEKLTYGADVLEKLLLGTACLAVGAICIKKSVLQKLSVNNHDLTFGEDWVLWCHLALHGDIIPATAKTVLYYRRHDSNTTAEFFNNAERIFAAYDAVYKSDTFFAAMGEEKMKEYEAYRHQLFHTRFATHYAKKGETDKAQYHLEQMTLRLDSFAKRFKGQKNEEEN